MLQRLMTPGTPHAVLCGMVLCFVTYFVFAVNDALGKALIVTFGLGQLMIMRSLGGFIILAPMIARGNDKPFVNVQRPGLQVSRAVLATLDTALFYAACLYLPLADVITFYMAGPIYLAVASRIFLKEQVSLMQWALIIFGFIGVLIALKPSSASFSLGAGFAIIGSVSYSLAMVINKVLNKTGDTSLVTYQTTFGLLFGLVLAIAAGNWAPMNVTAMGSLLVLGVTGTIGHLLLTRSVKLAPVSVLAPFQYTLLLWGVILGFLFFDEIPDQATLIGAVMIIIAGFFLFRLTARRPAQSLQS
jgi:S-adenosylmethionine uptake transporter